MTHRRLPKLTHYPDSHGLRLGVYIKNRCEPYSSRVNAHESAYGGGDCYGLG
jgi:hypothetical protein